MGGRCRSLGLFLFLAMGLRLRDCALACEGSGGRLGGLLLGLAASGHSRRACESQMWCLVTHIFKR